MAAAKGIAIPDAAAHGGAGAPPLLKTGSVHVEYPKLIIVKATYGLNKVIDVTAHCRKQQANQGGGLSFPEKAEFNWTFGDPEPGANKALKLWWKYGDDGDVLEQHWYENGGRKAVALPKDDRPGDKYHGTLYFQPQRVRDLAGWGTKHKSVYVKLEVSGGAVASVTSKPTDTKANAKEPDFVAAPAAQQPVSIHFEGQVDQNSTVTISLLSKGLLLDDVVGRTTVTLGALSGDRSDGRCFDLFDEKTRKIVTAKLYFQCTYQGRGGPRAPRIAAPGGASVATAAAATPPVAAAPVEVR